MYFDPYQDDFYYKNKIWLDRKLFSSSENLTEEGEENEEVFDSHTLL